LDIDSLEGFPDLKILQLEKPDGWHQLPNDKVVENLKKFNFEISQLNDLVNSHNGSATYLVYMKYDRHKHIGVIPTIQVNVRENFEQNMDSFYLAMDNGIFEMFDLLDCFRVTLPLEKVEIDGIQSLRFMSSFTVNYKGEEVMVSSWTYLVPFKGHYYQINFSDLLNDNCDSIYNEVFNEMKFINK
jgi:hypothetical protein